MNYAAEWDAAHKERLMIAAEPDPRLVEFAKQWDTKAIRESGHIVPVLDIGCGTGRSSEWLAEQGLTVWGFDSSPNAVLRAYHRLTGQRRKLPHFMIADFTKPWPYTPASFHAVVDIRALENLNLDQMVFAWQQVARVLMRGGKFLSICASPKRDDALTTVGKVTKLTKVEITGMCKLVGLTAEVESQECVHENGKIVHDWQIIATKP